MRTDVTPVLTRGMVVADMVPDNPGTWLFHGHVGGHLRAGMQALYTVETSAAAETSRFGSFFCPIKATNSSKQTGIQVAVDSHL